MRQPKNWISAALAGLALAVTPVVAADPSPKTASDVDARVADYRMSRSLGKCAAKSAGSKACMKVRWRMNQKAGQ